MRYAIFADIHSNLEAFEAVLKSCEEENIDKHLCVGDIVGYAVNPKECIKVVQDRKITTVAGNHDWAVSGKFNIDNLNPYAKKAVLWTREEVDSADVEYLSNLELVYREDDFYLVHGTLFNPDNFHYMYEVEDAVGSFKAMDTTLCFIGHTHIPGIFIKDDEDFSYTTNNFITIEPEKQYIVNVGSVGQPRDRDIRASFCIYDSREKFIQIRRIGYNIQTTQTKIVNAGLPAFLAMRLNLGQ